MSGDIEKRVRLYVALGYAPSKIDRILGLEKGGTKKILLKLWREGSKV